MNGKKAHILAGLLTTTMTAVVFAGGTPEYELIIIEPWDTNYSLATSGVSSINNLNQVSGGAYRAGGAGTFLWTYETGKQLIDFAGQINDLGYIADGGWIRHPDGTLVPLTGGINGVGELTNSNLIAGSTGSVHTCPKHAAGRESAYWTEAGGTVRFDQDLGFFGSDQSWGANENNEIVGVFSTTGQCGDQKAFYYNINSGQYLNLHTMFTGMSSGITKAFDINNNGVVVLEGPRDGLVQPAKWSVADGFTVLPTLPSADPQYTHPKSINDHNVIVGSALSFEDDWEWYAVIWDADGNVRNLNDLVGELPPGFIIEEAKKINNNGWIIGRGHYGAWSPERAVVLVPIEHQSLPGDLDNNSVVDVTDLFMLLSAWGTNGHGAILAAPTDVVDTADLFQLLANWG